MKTRPASALPTPTDHFTNFTEISYGKTRNSYDFSEVPRTTPRPPLLASPVRPERAEMGANDPDFQFFRP